MVSKIMQLNNLEFDQEYKLYFLKDFLGIYFKIDKDYKMYICNIKDKIPAYQEAKSKYFSMFFEPEKGFSDEIYIEKADFIPSDEQVYYYLAFDRDFSNTSIKNSFWGNRIFDRANYIIGNCFRTEKEAEDNKNKIIKILRGEPLIKLENIHD